VEKAMMRATFFLLGAFLLMQTGILTIARQTEPHSAGRAFVTDFGDGLHVYRRWRDGSGVRQMSRVQILAGGRLAWSPDGRWLAYADSGLIVVSAGRRERIRVTSGSEFAPTWSADSQTLVYQAFYDSNWDIYSINRHTRQTRRLTSHHAVDSAPAWSPDGEWIAFVSERDGSADVFRIRPDGSGLQNLTSTGLENELAPIWSSSGEWIHYEVGRDRFERMHADGSTRRRDQGDTRDVVIPSRMPVISLQWRMAGLVGVGVLMLLGSGIIARWFKFSRGT
jgi:Tol biopolymer transport system component